MSLVVSDTSPISLLVQIDLIELLPRLFENIVVPPDIAAELSDVRSPRSVRDLVANRPTWLQIQSPTSLQVLPDLHTGEIAAISLCVELKCPLLIDERDGRKAAQSLGIPVVGVIGILETAAKAGLIEDLAYVHQTIRTTRFHISEAVLRESLRRLEEYRDKRK